MRLWHCFILLAMIALVAALPARGQNPFEQAYDDLIDGYYTTLKDSDGVAISIKGDGELYKGLIVIDDECLPLILRENGNTLSGYYEMRTKTHLILIGVVAKIDEFHKMDFKNRVEVFTLPLTIAKEELDQKIAHLMKLEWKFWENSYHLLQYDPPWEKRDWESEDERLAVYLRAEGKGMIMLNKQRFEITYERKGMMIQGMLIRDEEAYPFVMQPYTESRLKLVAGRYSKVVSQIRE